ncbi:MAG: valyl-tRNA synthetase, valyl-tRNA synthetase [Candidatus Parcubacteria bacterium]|jgi:valyl-tRNA synthetase
MATNIPAKLLSPYNPAETETPIYQLWQKSGLFNPDESIKLGITKPDADPFTIILPPPNVTGTLHLGHALMITIQDILIRFKRMQGKKTLWIPGTDHAAIATQAKVEKEISKKEGKSRYDLGREEMLKRIEAFAQQSHDTIVSQVKRLGASTDWSREAFTLDEQRNLAVRTVFKKMFDDGLIYQGSRIVNWDPKGQTTIADDEIVYEEEKSKFYYFKYGPFTIGTARPETKFGDKYVVMHPDDARYAAYEHGQKIDLEWINGPITATVIKDTAIDMEFGTGVMTITPWHSNVDFEIAERHSLDKEQIIDKYGKLLPIAGEFAGMKIKEAREKIVEKLQSKGLVEKIEDTYVHKIATAERTNGIIEPQIMKQWFVAVNKEFTTPHSEINGIASGSKTTLKELMRKAVDGKQVQILPDHFDKTYFHWIDNLRDWCISRQIWYGHRIPVWYKSSSLGLMGVGGGSQIYCGIEAPEGEGWVQDEDTLDTWFSSGLWTFSTLGWPSSTVDLKTYHPTNILVTGYEILFFWVARMILMTGYMFGTIPFSTVYLNGTVRDSQGRKMSKSLGNGGDPIETSEKYGADALRMFLATATTPGMDSRIYEDKIKGYKHFSNKLWNITRFILTNTENYTYDAQFSAWSEADEALTAERTEFIQTITKEMEEYKLHLSSEHIYKYVWTRFADVILEESKLIFKDGDEAAKASRAQFLHHTLRIILRVTHPYMPHVTEELWLLLTTGKSISEISEQNVTIEPSKLLLAQSWPA